MATSGKRGRSSTPRKRAARSSKSSYSRAPSASKGTTYRGVTNAIKNKISSYQTLVKQSQGPKKGGAPSPAKLYTLARWVDKGAVIQTVSKAQIQRWSKTARSITSPAGAKTVLAKKFGKSPIKAVCVGRGSNFIVATSPTVKGKMFKLPR